MIKIVDNKITRLSKLYVIHISKTETKTLSANKSSKAPISELCLFFLAMNPSKKSVMEATIKVITEKKKNPFSKKIIIGTVSNILEIDKMFGRFTLIALKMIINVFCFFFPDARSGF